MNNLTKKSYLFFSKDGYTYDKSHNQTNNMQILGSGMGKNFNEAFKDFKKNQSYLLSLDYENVMAVKIVGKFIINMEENKMELIPKELINTIPKLYETEEQNDPIAYVKLFLDGWTWYITEFSIDKNICFGYVISPFCSGELGYFSLEEIKSIRGSFGISVESDLSFKPTKLSIIKKAS